MTKTQKLERLLSIFIPLVITIIVFLYLGTKKNDITFDVYVLDGLETIKMVIGIWGTLLGFSIAAESILIAVNGGDLTNIMVSSGHLRTMLFSFMVTNIIIFMCLISFIPIILFKMWNFDIYRIFIGALFLSFLSLAISLFYFFIMLSTVHK